MGVLVGPTEYAVTMRTCNAHTRLESAFGAIMGQVGLLFTLPHAVNEFTMGQERAKKKPFSLPRFKEKNDLTTRDKGMIETRLEIEMGLKKLIFLHGNLEPELVEGWRQLQSRA